MFLPIHISIFKEQNSIANLNCNQKITKSYTKSTYSKVNRARLET